MKCISVRSSLARAGRFVIREGDAEVTTFASVELMHVAGHAGRNHPGRDGVRIQKRAIDTRARRVHVATNMRGSHTAILTGAV